MQHFISGSFCLDIIGDIYFGFAFRNSFFFFFVIWREEDTDKTGNGEWKIMEIFKISLAKNE